MFTVIDWHSREAYGPFATADLAGEWLAKQGIYEGEYDNQEVSIVVLRAPTEELKPI